MDIAGRYADVLDLNGSSRRSKVAGADLPGADARRRLTTTSADLEQSVARVRSASAAAGRHRDAVTMSVLVGWLECCAASEVADVAARICRENGLPAQSLDDCPYALLGEPSQIADRLLERRERFGLEIAIMAGSIDPQRFCQDVLPRVSACADARFRARGGVVREAVEAIEAVDDRLAPGARGPAPARGGRALGPRDTRMMRPLARRDGLTKQLADGCGQLAQGESVFQLEHLARRDGRTQAGAKALDLLLEIGGPTGGAFALGCA